MFKGFEYKFKSSELKFKAYEHRLSLILRTFILNGNVFLFEGIQIRSEYFCYFEWSMISHAPLGALANSV